MTVHNKMRHCTAAIKIGLVGFFQSIPVDHDAKKPRIKTRTQ